MVNLGARAQEKNSISWDHWSSAVALHTAVSLVGSQDPGARAPLSVCGGRRLHLPEQFPALGGTGKDEGESLLIEDGQRSAHLLSSHKNLRNYKMTFPFS